MGEQSGGSGSAGSIPNHLAILVPSFDPATDDVLEWSNKVTLLLQAWPSDKYRELATRLILNSKGSAFQKLNLHQKEILVNEADGVKKLVELVGGSWGQVPLKKQFDLVEKAVWRGIQKNDESGDSYINRMDVVWTELLARHLDMSQLKAYVLQKTKNVSSPKLV